MDELLTIEQLAARLGYSPKTVRNKMAAGIFKKGVHYSRTKGLRPLFKWSAVLALYEWQDDTESGPVNADIPMSRGYQLGGRR